MPQNVWSSWSSVSAVKLWYSRVFSRVPCARRSRGRDESEGREVGGGKRHRGRRGRREARGRRAYPHERADGRGGVRGRGLDVGHGARRARSGSPRNARCVRRARRRIGTYESRKGVFLFATTCRYDHHAMCQYSVWKTRKLRILSKFETGFCRNETGLGFNIFSGVGIGHRHNHLRASCAMERERLLGAAAPNKRSRSTSHDARMLLCRCPMPTHYKMLTLRSVSFLEKPV